LEQECQTQLLADAAAAGRNTQTVKIAPEEAAFTYSATGTERAGYFMASVGPVPNDEQRNLADYSTALFRGHRG